MDKLIEALNILAGYDKPEFPTNCTHDTLWVNVSPRLVLPQDIARLAELHFHPDREQLGFYSVVFGSC